MPIRFYIESTIDVKITTQWPLSRGRGIGDSSDILLLVTVLVTNSGERQRLPGARSSRGNVEYVGLFRV